MMKKLKIKNLSWKWRRVQKGSPRLTCGKGAVLHCVSVNTLWVIKMTHYYTCTYSEKHTHTQMRTSTYTILEDAEYSWQTESVLVSQLQPSVGFEDSPSSQLDKGLTSSPTYYFLPSRWSCNYLRMRSLTMRKRRPEIQGEESENMDFLLQHTENGFRKLEIIPRKRQLTYFTMCVKYHMYLPTIKGSGNDH